MPTESQFVGHTLRNWQRKIAGSINSDSVCFLLTPFRSVSFSQITMTLIWKLALNCHAANRTRAKITRNMVRSKSHSGQNRISGVEDTDLTQILSTGRNFGLANCNILF